MKEVDLIQVKDSLIPLNVGGVGNLILKEGVRDITGYTISSTIRGGSKPDIKYCLAKWGQGKGSYDRGKEKLKEGRWLTVEAVNPTLEDRPDDLPDSIASGSGIIVRDNNEHVFYLSTDMVNGIEGLIPNNIFKKLESSK